MLHAVQTRQTMYVWLNNEAHLRNNCCREKATRITYYVRARVCARVCGCTRAGVCFCACSITYPASNAPPYYHLQSFWLHCIYQRYLINGTIFGRNLLNIKCVFLFSLQLLFQTFLLTRRIRQDIVTNVKMSLCKVPLIFIRVQWNLTFPDILSKKNSNFRFNQDPSSGNRVPCRRTEGTDGHNEAKNRFSQFLKRA